MIRSRIRSIIDACTVRRLVVLFVILALAAVAASLAWGYWTPGDAHGNAAASATLLNQGATPTAVGYGTSVVVSWGISSTDSGRPADGYIVNRYDANSGFPETTLGGCSGIVAASSCTETGVPAGDWKYTITPVIGDNWRGPVSPLGGVVETGPTTLRLAQSVFGPPLPTVTTGTLSGFGPNEGISYELDGTPIAGSPSQVGPNGTATITSLSIPSGLSDGPHTIEVIGNNPVAPSQAQASILIDTTAPTIDPLITPAPNAAGWNNTSPVEVNGAVDTGGGSGIAYVKYTSDGTDPVTSSTAQYALTPPIATKTTTYKFYGVDLAGNASAVQTIVVKIDTTPPAPSSVSLVNVHGGAWLDLPHDITYYRGIDAGSYQYDIGVNDGVGADASGPASASDSPVSGTDTGFSNDSATITTPTGGPYVLNPISWFAGTTSNPLGTVTLTDVAGNTLVTSGQVINDSAAPSGGSVDATGLSGPGGDFSTSRTVNLSLLKGSDSGSGLADGSTPTDLPNKLMRASAPLTSSNGVAVGTCGTYSAYVQVQANNPPSTLTDTVPTDDTCYRYQYLVPDHVGNLATYTTPDIKVQTAAAPSLTPSGVTLTAVSGINSQSVTGSTVFYNPAQSGSFNVDASASAPYSGVAQMNFPAIAGFTGGGAVTSPFSGTRFRATYAWSANGTSPSPGLQPLSATNYAGQTATNPTAFSIISDVAGPSGGSVDAIGLSGTGGRYSTSTALSVAFSPGSDSGSGLAASGAQLLRASAALTSTSASNGTCGTFGAYTQVGANDPSSPVSNTVPVDGTCYRYQYVVADKLGNQSTYTSPDIKVDSAAPPAPTLSFTGLSNAIWNAAGTTLYYRPAAGSGGFTLTASSADSTAGISGYTLPNLPAGWTNTPGVSSVQSYSWASPNPTAPTNPLTVTATNNTGQTNSSAFSVIADASGPSGGSVDATGLSGTGGRYSTSTTLSVAFSPGVDSGSGLAASGAQLLRASAALTSNGVSNGTCGTFGAYTQVGANDPSSPVSNTVPADATCYRYQYLVADKLGNQSTYTSPDIKVDTAAPPAPTLTFTNLSNSYWSATGTTVYYNPNATSGAFTLTAHSTDTVAGVGSYSVPTFSAGWSSTAGALGVETYSYSAANPTIPAAGQNVTATSNTGTQSGPATFTAAPDSAGPSGGSVDATGLAGTGGRYSTSTTISIAFGKGTDSGSGLAPAGAQLLRASAALSSGGTGNGSCGTYSAYTVVANDPASPYSNTVPTAQTCYRYQYVVSDNLGNQTTYTSSDIKVQTDKPSSLTPTASTITPLTGTSSQVVSGSTVYYNPAQAGSFTVSSSASDAGSGIAQLAFPTFTGFTGGANATTPTSGTTFTTTYSWSANGASPSPGPQSLTATDNAGLTATNNTAFSIIADSTGPAGGSVDATGLAGTGGRYSTSTTLSIAFSKGTDGGSGLAPTGAQLLRASAALSAGSCGTYGAFTQVGSNDPGSPVSNTVPADHTCYRYQYVVADTVGNQTTYTSPDIKVDTSIPSTPTLSFSSLSNSYWSGTGNTVYYNPSATSGAFTLTANSTDAVAGVGSYALPTFPAGWSSTAGALGVETYSYSAANPTAPSAGQNVTATSNTGTQSAAATLTATPDNTGPSGGSVSYTNGLYTTPTVSVAFTPGSDSGSGVNASSGALQRSAASLTGSTCGTFGTYATIASNPTSPYTDTVPANHSCYQYRYLISDNVSNQTIYTSPSVVQLATTAASIGTVIFQNAFSDNTVDGTGAVTLPTPLIGPNTACLTATGNTVTPPLLSCVPSIDSQGSGVLRLTRLATSQVGGIFATTSFPTSNGIDVKFNSYQYGGTTHADGIAFLLAAVNPADPVAPASLGASGGTLGYSTMGTLNGLTHAYLGVGLDAFGNFSSNTYSGTGCSNPSNISSREAGAVVVRGPGNGLVGYCGLTSTYTGTAGSLITLTGATRAASAVPVEVLINPTNTSFTSASGVTVAAGGYEVVVTPVGQATRTLTGSLPSVAAGLYPASWLSANGVPSQLAFGFDASTGAVTDVHEISNVQVATFSSVPQLAVNTTSYSAATPSPGAPVTYGVTASVIAGANETSPISVTQTVPTGVVPVGAYGSGWVCQSPLGQSITCTTSGSSFTGGTALPVINVDAIVTGSTVTSTLVQSGSTATASSVDSNPGTASSATAGTLPTAPSSITVVPSIGATAGGGTVTVGGSNIAAATAIEIGTTAQQQAGTPVTLLPCPGAAAPGCFTVVAGSLVISSMPALASPATVSVTVVTSGLAAAANYVYANPPAAPATPTATAGVTTATVTWVAPASNGSPITGYIITPYLAGVAQTPLSFDASTTTRTLTGLTHNSSYTFTVAAVNLSGTSNASPSSAAVIP